MTLTVCRWKYTSKPGDKMKDFLPKLKNWWWYNKLAVIVALAAAAVIVYSFIPAGTDVDFHVALVTATPHSEAELLELEAKLARHAADINGDGEVRVQLHFYPVDLADDDPNAGAKNYQFVSALDADLVGHTSDIFLLEDVAAFQRATGDKLSGEQKSFEGYFAAIRKDAGEEAVAMFERLK